MGPKVMKTPELATTSQKYLASASVASAASRPNSPHMCPCARVVGLAHTHTHTHMARMTHRKPYSTMGVSDAVGNGATSFTCSSMTRVHEAAWWALPLTTFDTQRSKAPLFAMIALDVDRTVTKRRN